MNREDTHRDEFYTAVIEKELHMENPSTISPRPISPPTISPPSLSMHLSSSKAPKGLTVLEAQCFHLLPTTRISTARGTAYDSDAHSPKTRYIYHPQGFSQLENTIKIQVQSQPRSTAGGGERWERS